MTSMLEYLSVAASSSCIANESCLQQARWAKESYSEFPTSIAILFILASDIERVFLLTSNCAPQCNSVPRQMATDCAAYPQERQLVRQSPREDSGSLIGLHAQPHWLPCRRGRTVLLGSRPVKSFGRRCLGLPHEEVAAALQKVRESHVSPAAKLLFTFATLTASRSGEARLARWSEVDLEKRVWTVPAERMKAKREHRVPLATQTIQVLADAQRLADGSGLIFPSPTRLGPLGTNTLIRLCHDLRLGCTPHGMRSSFRTWCGETEQPRELAEQALAHVNPNRVEAAYMRSDLFERRRELMQAWSANLLQPKATETG